MERFERWLKRNEIPYTWETAIVNSYITWEGLERDEVRTPCIRMEYDRYDLLTASSTMMERARKYARKNGLRELYVNYHYGTALVLFVTEEAYLHHKAMQKRQDEELEIFWQNYHEQIKAE